LTRDTPEDKNMKDSAVCLLRNELRYEEVVSTAKEGNLHRAAASNGNGRKIRKGNEPFDEPCPKVSPTKVTLNERNGKELPVM